MKIERVILEYPQPVNQKYIVQAYLQSMRAWLTITVPTESLSEANEDAERFYGEHGVHTRIKKVTETSNPYHRLSKYVSRNRGVFEQDGYRKRHTEAHTVKRDTTATEQLMALEDVE